MPYCNATPRTSDYSSTRVLEYQLYRCGTDESAKSQQLQLGSSECANLFEPFKNDPSNNQTDLTNRHKGATTANVRHCLDCERPSNDNRVNIQ